MNLKGHGSNDPWPFAFKDPAPAWRVLEAVAELGSDAANGRRCGSGGER